MGDPQADLDSYGAIVLAGGQGTRLGGFDKSSAEVGGRTLLDLALDALVDAAEVVVVGEQVPTERPVSFVLESPRYGGPVAALLTGSDLLLRHTRLVVVVAVDMPLLTHRTIRRLCSAASDRDGAVLVGPDGRRQLALALSRDRLAVVRPDLEGQHGMAVRTLLADLDLAEVAAVDDEHRDVDTWADLRDLRGDGARTTRAVRTRAASEVGLRNSPPAGEGDPVNLHDWIDELCDALDLETEVDEGLLKSLGQLTTAQVDPAADVVTTYLLGYAAGAAGAGPALVEQLATRAQELAERWDTPVLADPDDEEDEIELGLDLGVDEEEEE